MTRQRPSALPDLVSTARTRLVGCLCSMTATRLDGTRRRPGPPDEFAGATVDDRVQVDPRVRDFDPSAASRRPIPPAPVLPRARRQHRTPGSVTVALRYRCLGAAASRSSMLPDMIVRMCSLMCSTGQSHQARARRRVMSSSW